jgi:hypothetical protein
MMDKVSSRQKIRLQVSLDGARIRVAACSNCWVIVGQKDPGGTLKCKSYMHLVQPP